ncbi:MAG: glycosyltransferase family 2 protein [Proteobacteria bacterium]|nr:glycosyltransferase family 2 protein [Pseudomonadota bacterium]
METIEPAKSLLSIICPVFNEELAIPLFYQRIKIVFDQLVGIHYELIFTNNASSDRSLEEIHKIKKVDSNVSVLTLSRNFGYQASILAGMKHARGDCTLVIDVDCEDPPEMIGEFVQKWREGYDICYGIRGKRDEARWVTWFRLLFYRIMKLTADTDIILDMAEFALLSRRVRSVLINNSNTFPFLRAEIAYSGFRKIGIPYDRQRRIIGRTHYNLWRMFLFAAAGIMSVSTFPLRAAVYGLPLLVLLNVLGLFFDNGSHDFFRILVAANLVYLALTMSAQGLYIARIYKNGIGRPIYIVDWDRSDASLFSESVV